MKHIDVPLDLTPTARLRRGRQNWRNSTGASGEHGCRTFGRAAGVSTVSPLLGPLLADDDGWEIYGPEAAFAGS